MFQLGKLFVALEAKTSAFDAALDSAEQRTKATAAAIADSGRFDLGAKQDSGLDKGAEVGAMAAQIRAALASAMAPMEGIAARMASMMDRLGGTVVTLARRIDASIKFPAADKALEGLQAKLRTAIAKAAGDGEQELTRLQRAIQRLGPAADKAITAFRGFSKIREIMANMGDVAGKSMSSMKGMTFDAPARSAQRMAGEVRGIAKATQSATTTVKNFGREAMIALGLFGLAYKAVTFIKGGIDEASHLNETLAKTKEIFGASTGLVTAQADKMAKAFGIAKRPILDAASNFGIFFQEAGQSAQSSAELSNKMVMLAADMSSFADVPLPDMLQKLKSGLSGEVEPLRSVGIFLNEDAVAAEAVAKGFAKSKKEVDEHAKILARASLIMNSTAMAKASGDLERTADSAANQFRKAGGGMENFATAIGSVLLPAVQSGTIAFNEFLSSVVETFEANRGIIDSWAGYLTSAMDTVGMVLRNWPDVWEIAKLSILEKIINIGEYIATLPENLGIIAEYVAGNWKEMLVDAFNAVATVLHNLGDNIGRFAYAVYQFMKDPTKGFQFEWGSLTEGFEATAAALPQMIKPHLTSLQDEIEAAGGRINERERRRAEGLAKNARAAGEHPGKETKHEEKAKSSGLAEFAADLRAKQRDGKDSVPAKQLTALEKIVKAVEAKAKPKDHESPLEARLKASKTNRAQHAADRADELVQRQAAALEAKARALLEVPGRLSEEQAAKLKKQAEDLQKKAETVTKLKKDASPDKDKTPEKQLTALEKIQASSEATAAALNGGIVARYA